MTTSLKPAAVRAPAYRLLESGEVIQAGDEHNIKADAETNEGWLPTLEAGCAYRGDRSTLVYRRAISK